MALEPATVCAANAATSADIVQPPIMPARAAVSVIPSPDCEEDNASSVSAGDCPGSSGNDVAVSDESSDEGTTVEHRCRGADVPGKKPTSRSAPAECSVTLPFERSAELPDSGIDRSSNQSTADHDTARRKLDGDTPSNAGRSLEPDVVTGIAESPTSKAQNGDTPSGVKQQEDGGEHAAETSAAPCAKVVVPSGWPRRNENVMIDDFEKGTAIWGDPSVKESQPILRWLSSNRRPNRSNECAEIKSVLKSRQVNQPTIIVPSTSATLKTTHEKIQSTGEIKKQINITRTNENRIGNSGKPLRQFNEIAVGEWLKEGLVDTSSWGQLLQRNEFDPNEGTVDTSSWSSASSTRRWEQNCQHLPRQQSKPSSNIVTYDSHLQQACHRGHDRRDQFGTNASRLQDFSKTRPSVHSAPVPQHYVENKPFNPLDSFMLPHGRRSNTFSMSSSVYRRSSSGTQRQAEPLPQQEGWRHSSNVPTWSDKRSPRLHCAGKSMDFCETHFQPDCVDPRYGGDQFGSSQDYNRHQHQSLLNAAKFLLHRMSSNTVAPGRTAPLLDEEDLLDRQRMAQTQRLPPYAATGEVKAANAYQTAGKLDADLRRVLMQLTSEQRNRFGLAPNERVMSNSSGIASADGDEFEVRSSRSVRHDDSKHLPDQGTRDIASALFASFSGLTGFGSAQLRQHTTKQQSQPEATLMQKNPRTSCEYPVAADASNIVDYSHEDLEGHVSAVSLYEKIIKQQFRLSVHAGLLPARLMESKLSVEVLHYVNQMFALQLRLQQLHMLGRRCLSSYSINNDGSVSASCAFSNNNDLGSSNSHHFSAADTARTNSFNVEHFSMLMEILRRKILSLSHSIIQLHRQQQAVDDKTRRPHTFGLTDSGGAPGRTDYLSRQGVYERDGAEDTRAYHRTDPYKPVANRPASATEIAKRMSNAFSNPGSSFMHAMGAQNFPVPEHVGTAISPAMDRLAACLSSQTYPLPSWFSSNSTDGLNSLSSSMNAMNLKDGCSNLQEQYASNWNLPRHNDAPFMQGVAQPVHYSDPIWLAAAPDWDAATVRRTQAGDSEAANEPPFSPSYNAQFTSTGALPGRQHLVKPAARSLNSGFCPPSGVVSGCEQFDLYSIVRPYSYGKQSSTSPSKTNCIYVQNIRAANLPYIKSLLHVVGEEPAFKLIEEQAMVFLQFSQANHAEIALRTLKEAGLSASILPEECVASVYQALQQIVSHQSDKLMDG